MRISIGIVAWNEAESIRMTIESLFSQRLFRRHHEGLEGIEVMVLANGCTDGTQTVARSALALQLDICPLKYVVGQVCELPGPDRPGAWNKFIHHLANPDSDYIVMMDADIYFNNPDAIWKLVEALEQDPQACAASSRGIKDVATLKRKGLFNQMCLVMTDMIQRASAPRPCLTGGCYCGRSKFWRRIELPMGMKGDDAFLSRMVTTSLLTTKPDYRRIARPPDATFVFEAYDDPWILFKQHRRRTIGRYIESLIYEDVGREVERTGRDAGEILHCRNRENPQWLTKLVRKRTANVGWSAVPVGQIFLRFTQWSYQPFPQSVLRLPLAMLGMVWDMAVVIAATHVMKRDRMKGVWFDTRNKRLLNDVRFGPMSPTQDGDV